MATPNDARGQQRIEDDASNEARAAKQAHFGRAPEHRLPSASKRDGSYVSVPPPHQRGLSRRCDNANSDFVDATRSRIHAAMTDRTAESNSSSLDAPITECADEGQGLHF